MMAWVLGYLMLAKTMTRLFVVDEIIFAFLFVLVLLAYTLNRAPVVGESP